jgi:hypothetical protein
MAYWTAARYVLAQERVALHFLRLAGFEVYLPRLREQRILRGRRVEVTPPLFPSYCFVAIELQWHAAHRAPGTNGLVMNGGGPAHVPDNVIAELGSLGLRNSTRLARRELQVRRRNHLRKAHLKITRARSHRDAAACKCRPYHQCPSGKNLVRQLTPCSRADPSSPTRSARSARFHRQGDPSSPCRAPDYESGGRRFESVRARQKINNLRETLGRAPGAG